MVKEQTGTLAHRQGGAVHQNFIAFGDIERRTGQNLVIDADAPGFNPFLGLAAGAKTGPCHDFGNAVTKAPARCRCFIPRAVARDKFTLAAACARLITKAWLITKTMLVAEALRPVAPVGTVGAAFVLVAGTKTRTWRTLGAFTAFRPVAIGTGWTIAKRAGGAVITVTVWPVAIGTRRTIPKRAGGTVIAVAVWPVAIGTCLTIPKRAGGTVITVTVWPVAIGTRWTITKRTGGTVITVTLGPVAIGTGWTITKRAGGAVITVTVWPVAIGTRRTITKRASGTVITVAVWPVAIGTRGTVIAPAEFFVTEFLVAKTAAARWFVTKLFGAEFFVAEGSVAFRTRGCIAALVAAAFIGSVGCGAVRAAIGWALAPSTTVFFAVIGHSSADSRHNAA